MNYWYTSNYSNHSNHSKHSENSEHVKLVELLELVELFRVLYELELKIEFEVLRWGKGVIESEQHRQHGQDR